MNISGATPKLLHPAVIIAVAHICGCASEARHTSVSAHVAAGQESELTYWPDWQVLKPEDFDPSSGYGRGFVNKTIKKGIHPDSHRPIFIKVILENSPHYQVELLTAQKLNA